MPLEQTLTGVDLVFDAVRLVLFEVMRKHALSGLIALRQKVTDEAVQLIDTLLVVAPYPVEKPQFIVQVVPVLLG